MRIDHLMLALASILFLNMGRANEPYRKKEFWLRHGFAKVDRKHTFSSRAEASPPWTAHSLKWPIAFQDDQHSLGNSMLEFQSYGDGPYYHGGLVLRVKKPSPVYATVCGSVESGHN
jgi:hypothetical protein